LTLIDQRAATPSPSTCKTSWRRGVATCPAAGSTQSTKQAAPSRMMWLRLVTTLLSASGDRGKCA
jgi:hypothetical protein